MLTRRETLKGVALLGATEKLTDGGFASISMPGVPKRVKSVMPPGAGKRKNFESKCLACGLCMTVCPEGVLKPSTSWSRLGLPELDFRSGRCLVGCVKCTQVCPVGALEPLQMESKSNVHIGRAVWRKDLCVITTNGDKCTACERKCPVRAVHIVKGFPVVDDVKCIGCGACEHSCPARPMPAIYVEGYDEQRKVVPMSESDLIAEMKTLIESGDALVIARNGVIERRIQGHGVKPLYDEYDSNENSFKGALVYDKIVGKAAAAIYVVGGAKKVCADVMSEEAAKLLEKHGVETEMSKKVKNIINHEGTGICPMENAVEGITEPKLMIEAVRKRKI